jgi:hypothetical protein
LPSLFQDIRDVGADHLQADPTFQTTRRYGPLSAAAVRDQLLRRQGYRDEQLPSARTIASQLNLLGLRLRTVAKSRPPKS